MGVQIDENRQIHLSVTNSFSSVSANTTAEQTMTITGLKAGDSCITVNKKTAQAGLGIVGHRVSAADTLAVTFINATGSPITPTASDTYSVTVFRPEKTYTTVPS